jgi:hypothetical protein
VSQLLIRNQRARNLVPNRVKAAFAENRVRLVRVARRSDLRNVYHCCVHKTGSQWIRKILADPAVYRVTGLRTYAYVPRLPGGRESRSYSERRFDRAFPARTIVSPLYIPYANFDAFPKPEPWRALFIGRDPRDIVVSWYFSSSKSHPTINNPGLQRTRGELSGLDEEEGFIYTIRRLEAHGLFSALGTWADVDAPEVLLLRYEDLVGSDAEGWWNRLLDHCDVEMTPVERRALRDRYSFEALSGRKQGEEDTGSKLRKGVAGDWRNHFTPRVEAAFADATGDLLGRLGYTD